MTAIRFVQLRCESGTRGCEKVFPAVPQPNTAVTALRQVAVTHGWEVMRGTKHGRDACPSCRIAEIRQAADAVEGA